MDGVERAAQVLAEHEELTPGLPIVCLCGHESQGETFGLCHAGHRQHQARALADAGLLADIACRSCSGTGGTDLNGARCAVCQGTGHRRAER
jgi:hypothetical protein